MKLHGLSEGIIYEAGLSRLLAHAGNQFAVLTAFRGEHSKRENRKRNKQLESLIRGIGSGGIKLIGYWVEGDEQVREESYFVPKPQGMPMDEFNNWVISTINRFDQDAAIVSDGKTIYIVDSTGDTMAIGDKVTIGKIGQAYSVLKGRPFVFEGTMRPSSIAHRMLLTRRGMQWL